VYQAEVKMSYCTVEDLRRVLPENILIGDQNIGTPVPGRSGNQGSGRSNITPQQAEQYILYGEQYIDGRLRPFYVCPLRRTKSFETEILSNVSPGSNVSVTVHDSGSFVLSESVRLQNKSAMETAVVGSVPDSTTLVLESVTGSYLVADQSKISILEYPDPIPIITARLACSFILDRLFVGQQAPDVSGYGKTMRNLARSAIEDIMAGAVTLFGQEFTGRRFVRLNLIEPLKSPAEINKGQDKE
jgi:hypothetical protein